MLRLLQLLNNSTEVCLAIFGLHFKPIKLMVVNYDADFYLIREQMLIKLEDVINVQ